MPPKGASKTPQQLVQVWRSDPKLKCLKTEIRDGQLFIGCEPCISAKACNRFAQMRPFTGSNGNAMIKTEVMLHCNSKDHHSSLDIIAKREHGLPAIMQRQAEVAQAVKEGKDFEEMANKARTVLFLAEEEVALRKYTSLLDLLKSAGAKNCETSGVEGHHGSGNAAWEIVEAAAEIVKEQNLALIQSATQVSIILDLTSEDLEWMIVYAKVAQTNGKIRTVFWELSHIENGCGDTIASCVIGLFDSSGVPISKLAYWASDG